jgi:predicted DNA-binding transcriptional regulator YafY
VRLTEGELVAFFLAERLLDEYRGAPYAADLATAFRKLTAALPDAVTIDLSHLSEGLSFRQHAADAGDAAQFRSLARAVTEGRQLELVYWTASRDETCRRVVDPYHLASVDGNWYLVAYCHLREDVRMFVPSRIRRFRETGVRFDRPADFRIAEYLDVSFRAVRGTGLPQRVRLHFTPEAARFVRERTWHPSQQMEERKDGGVVLTLRVNHLLEVKRWALSYGAACRVLEPEELRRQVREELRQTLGQYE